MPESRKVGTAPTSDRETFRREPPSWQIESKKGFRMSVLLPELEGGPKRHGAEGVIWTVLGGDSEEIVRVQRGGYFLLLIKKFV